MTEAVYFVVTFLVVFLFWRRLRPTISRIEERLRRIEAELAGIRLQLAESSEPRSENHEEVLKRLDLIQESLDLSWSEKTSRGTDWL